MSPRALPPYPKWIIAVLVFLTPFIGLFDLVFGGVALATLGEQPPATEPGPGGFLVIPLMLLTPFNVALVVLWLGAINIFRRRRWLAAQWERPEIESAPPGTELLSDGPHIRLRAVNVSPLLAGLIGAGVTGFLCTFAGAALAIFAELSADTLGGGYAVLLIVGAGLPWYLRRRHLESGVHDLVVDPAGRALAVDGGDPGGPTGRDFDDIARVEVETKVTTSRTSDGKSSTKTDYLVHLRDAKGAAETLFTFGNEPTKAECVAHWLRTVIGVRDV